MSTLIYETTDSNFADLCVEALVNVDVAAFRTGQPLPGGTDFNICIYIQDSSQYQMANEVLIKLGAAVNTGSTLPSRRILILLAAAILFFAVVIATWGQVLRA